MAINFLNTVNFNQNELQNVVIDPTPAAPTTTEGAMYFDTTALDKTMYYWNGSSWVPMDGSGTGVTSLTLATATSTGAPLAISAGTGAITLTSNVYNGTTNVGYVPTGGGATTFLRGDGTWVTPTDTDTTYEFDLAAGAANTAILNLDASAGTDTSCTFSGTPSEIEVTETIVDPANGTVTIGLPDDVIITTSLTVNSGAAATRSLFGYQVTIPATPLVPTDAASKGYVDGLVEGGLTFKGTFDANDGEIVSGGSIGLFLYQLTGTAFDPTAVRVEVAVGDYYVVATAGDFYGDGGVGTCSPTRPMTIGDSIIAVDDAAADTSICADWSIIESDVGVTSVTASVANDELGLIITPTTGDVVAGIDIKGTTNLGAAPALDDEILLYDLDGDVNKAITVENLMQSATNGAYAVLNTTTTGVTQQVGPPASTEGWVIAVDTILSATAAIHVSCEVIRVSDGHTVYASVERATTNITVNFVGSGIAQGTYAVILNRVV
jgi:hypothetical protein